MLTRIQWERCRALEGFMDVQRDSDVPWRPWAQAREWARGLKLTNINEWYAYCKSGHKPADIPYHPERTYDEFDGYGDWLGTGNLSPHDREYQSFRKGRAFAHTLKLKNYTEWRVYCKSGRKPADIPQSPYEVYNEFAGYGDWLGTGTISSHEREYRPFKQARAFAHSLKLKSQVEWRVYSKSGRKPADIPSDPRTVYKEFAGDGDWLGTGTVADRGREYRPFKRARAWARSLRLKNTHEWSAYCQSGHKPADIPRYPDRVYEEFAGYGDWLGTGTVATRERKYRPFKRARAFTQSLRLKDIHEWYAYCASGKKPADIPSNPNTVYEDFAGYGDWLGTGNVAPRDKKFRAFKAARAFARSLKLKNAREWEAYSASGRPADIPSTPSRIYKDKGWACWGDWLGTSR